MGVRRAIKPLGAKLLKPKSYIIDIDNPGIKNFVFPSSISFVKITAIGAGGSGGGGGIYSWANYSGSGGGGGAMVSWTLSKSELEEINKNFPNWIMTIGAGGKGVPPKDAYAGGQGLEGGLSSIFGLNKTLIAYGGKGGNPANSGQPFPAYAAGGSYSVPAGDFYVKAGNEGTRPGAGASLITEGWGAGSYGGTGGGSSTSDATNGAIRIEYTRME